MRTLFGILFLATMIGFTAPAFALFGLPERVEGTLQEIESGSLTVHAVKGDSEQILLFRIDEGTEFSEESSPDNLHEGDRVKIAYREKDGEKIAVSVKKIMEKAKSELNI